MVLLFPVSPMTAACPAHMHFYCISFLGIAECHNITRNFTSCNSIQVSPKYPFPLTPHKLTETDGECSFRTNKYMKNLANNVRHIAISIQNAWGFSNMNGKIKVINELILSEWDICDANNWSFSAEKRSNGYNGIKKRHREDVRGPYAIKL
jgi:hypothetical protein